MFACVCPRWPPLRRPRRCRDCAVRGHIADQVALAAAGVGATRAVGTRPSPRPFHIWLSSLCVAAEDRDADRADLNPLVRDPFSADANVFPATEFPSGGPVDVHPLDQVPSETPPSVPRSRRWLMLSPCSAHGYGAHIAGHDPLPCRPRSAGSTVEVEPTSLAVMVWVLEDPRSGGCTGMTTGRLSSRAPAVTAPQLTVSPRASPRTRHRKRDRAAIRRLIAWPPPALTIPRMRKMGSSLFLRNSRAPSRDGQQRQDRQHPEIAA